MGWVYPFERLSEQSGLGLFVSQKVMNESDVGTGFQEVGGHSRSKVFVWSMASVKIGIVDPMDKILPSALEILSCFIRHAPLHGAVPGLQAWFLGGPEALNCHAPGKKPGACRSYVDHARHDEGGRSTQRILLSYGPNFLLGLRLVCRTWNTTTSCPITANTTR